MKNKNHYSAAIVGLGNVAMGYDGGSGDPSLTHLSALRRNGRICLRAGCSPVAKERNMFRTVTEAAVYDDLHIMLDAERPDLVSICSPTECHFDHALACVENGVPMIWLEKPPVSSCQQGKVLLRAVREQGTTVLVGYQRRYAEPFVSLREILRRGDHGGLLAVSVQYSLKLYRNGCHALDTVSFLLGDPEFSLRGAFDGEDHDTPSFLLSSGKLPVSFVGLAGTFHCLEITLTFPQQQLTVLNGGKSIIRRKVTSDPLYPSRWLNTPEEASEMNTLADNNGMDGALADLLSSREEGRQPVSSLESALRSQQVMEMVMEATNR